MACFASFGGGGCERRHLCIQCSDIILVRNLHSSCLSRFSRILFQLWNINQWRDWRWPCAQFTAHHSTTLGKKQTCSVRSVTAHTHTHTNPQGLSWLQRRAVMVLRKLRAHWLMHRRVATIYVFPVLRRDCRPTVSSEVINTDSIWGSTLHYALICAECSRYGIRRTHRLLKKRSVSVIMSVI